MIFILHMKKQMLYVRWFNWKTKAQPASMLFADDTDVFILVLDFYSEQQLTCILIINDGFR